MSLYCVKNGTLYGWKNHRHTLTDGRSRKSEELITSSLELAQQIVRNQHRKPNDPRFVELVTDPFPFFVDNGDFTDCGNNTYPIFTFATFSEEKPYQACIPLGIPSYEQWHIRKDDSAMWDVEFQKQEKRYPWASKIDKAIWRGGATGLVDIYPNWRDLPRSKLVQYSIDNPSLIDAGFKGFSQRSEIEKQEIESSGFLKDYMNMKDFQKFTAIIDIDGNSWSSRFVRLMCMNSVVLKVNPDTIDYFHPELKPFVHYLPVHGNLSNLIEMVRLATSQNDEEQQQMRSIVQNANDWCREKLTATSTSFDMSWIMISYLEILKKEDLSSKSFTKWRDDFHSNKFAWNDTDWVKLPFGFSRKK